MNGAILFDIFILVLLVTFCVRGLLRGLSGEVFSLVGVVGGVFLACRGAASGSILILRFFEISPSVARIISMVAIYAVTILFCALLCRVVKAFLSMTSLTFVDRVFGGVAGGVKTAVIVLFVYIVLRSFSPIVPEGMMSGSVAFRLGDWAWPHVERYLVDYGLISPDFIQDFPAVHRFDPRR